MLFDIHICSFFLFFLTTWGHYVAQTAFESLILLLSFLSPVFVHACHHRWLTAYDFFFHDSNIFCTFLLDR